MKRPPLPRGRAFTLGYRAAEKQPHILVASGFVEQRWTVDSVVEVYDDLSWEPFATNEDDWRDFLHGFAASLTGRLSRHVHLVYVHDRGNGHRDYRIVAGTWPTKRRGGRSSRRLNRQRRMQRLRARAWAMWILDERDALARTMSEYSAAFRAVESVMRRSPTGRKLPGYLPGWDRERVRRDLWPGP